ncbi:MAG: DUF445 family protein [SAR324 cluster bacterium]|nr:DUF445 family protein [SAR324 cluster bacterium]
MNHWEHPSDKDIAGNRINESAFYNKSLLTNVLSGVLVVIGLMLPEPFRNPVLSTGLFAVSGAVTNWLAIHMLFEKIPGLYGTGIIPARFNDFKRGIHTMVMEQFFVKENVAHFFDENEQGSTHKFDFTPIIEKLDFTPVFDSLVKTIMESPMSGMLMMVGGIQAIEPMKTPFIAKTKAAIEAIALSPEFQHELRIQLGTSSMSEDMIQKAEKIVKKRLDELTPEMVKEIIQQMIHQHLGWLVVWGGVFGGLIGLASSFFF